MITTVYFFLHDYLSYSILLQRLLQNYLFELFNSGYLLAKHDPEKLQPLLKETNSENALLKETKAGQKQIEKEKIIEQQKTNSKFSDMVYN